MLMVAAVLEAGHSGIAPWLMNQLRQLGQASFFVYVIQFYVYGIVLHTLRLPYTPFWPLIFLFTIALLVLVAIPWNWKEGNRFLTVGVGALFDRADRRRRATHEMQIAVDTLPPEDTAPLVARG
jgi:prepilin signal peptidase PulO-like enzyme (type II secretory pathway)